MRDFMSDNERPDYAILSHTWGEDEVTYQGYTTQREKAETQEGYRKIEYCQRQAIADKIEWFWVDTCCIDKTSSTELSEAINSMYRWYKESSVCYAYISDMEDTHDTTETISSQLENSRWLTRGWTLQELIAPSTVRFYSQGWQEMGNKKTSASLLSRITGISIEYLVDPTQLLRASVADRMSWASKRQTTRKEDIAYCLLGVFDINMPLLYGEGEKAFQRLQQEVMRRYPQDQSLFVWGKPRGRGIVLERAEIDEIKGLTPIKKSYFLRETDLHGLLAKSPEDFRDVGAITCSWQTRQFFELTNTTPPVVYGSSIRLDLPLLPQDPLLQYRIYVPNLDICVLRPVTFAVLLCSSIPRRSRYILIPLVRFGGYFMRTYNIQLSQSHEVEYWLRYNLFKRKTLCTVTPSRPPLHFDYNDMIFRSYVLPGEPAISKAICNYHTRAGDIEDGFLKGATLIGEQCAGRILVQSTLEVLIVSVFRTFSYEKNEYKTRFEISIMTPPLCRRFGLNTLNDLPQDVDAALYTQKPMHSHVMVLPVDTWNPHVGRFLVRIKVEKIRRQDDPHRSVDIIDIVVEKVITKKPHWHSLLLLFSLLLPISYIYVWSL